MSQTNTCKGTVYIVKEKDSLYQIAKAYGVKVRDIMRENPFVNVYNLQIGDELCVPGFLSVAENAYTPYIVKKGETILDIANMHKTTVENLAKSNKKIREMTLPVGTVLLIDKAKERTMIKYYRTMDHQIHEISEPVEGTWISLVHPTAAELATIAAEYKIDIDDLRAPLDEEERSHIEVEEGYTLFIVDVPTTEERKEKEYFLTIPCGIILTEKVIITVCLEDTSVLADFKNGRVRNFWTFKRTRFILQILYRNASLYLQYLRIIDKKSDSVEKQLHISTKNQELIELLELEKSLVYFSTSLRSNELVLEKMLKIDKIKQYPEDEELLDDVIIENKQAIEMADIYSNILSGTMDAYASVISNNLNIVMKVLAIITIVMSIPTMIASFWGMNVPVPLAHSPYGFLILVIVSLILTIFGGYILGKKNMF